MSYEEFSADRICLCDIGLDVWNIVLQGRYFGTQVAVAVREKEGDILITVTDDGPGFPEGGTEHLFDRFYKGKGGNHGLGLAIARCSLEYMGGSVRAADTQKGAEFEITLPQDCRSFAPDERTEM